MSLVVDDNKLTATRHIVVAREATNKCQTQTAGTTLQLFCPAV